MPENDVAFNGANGLLRHWVDTTSFGSASPYMAELTRRNTPHFAAMVVIKALVCKLC
jgi:hypothetical protein